MSTSLEHLVLILLLIFSLNSGVSANDAPPEKSKNLISEMRQLTFDGPKAGEGYFSPDGSQMVFQSERQDENPFYQIYLMDLKKKKIQRISPGFGKTSCSWIHPGLEKVMFSSTHDDPDFNKKVKEEFESRKNPKAAKYSWSFDDQFKIYDYNLKTKKYKTLFGPKGYSAEGSYSSDGKKIAFASNFRAYQGILSAQDHKKLEADPSYFIDLFIMDADGKNLKQLTHTPGYDGGPFFSPDGTHLTWRRFSVDGKSAEVFTMKIDGQEEKQITHLQAMSWAPFYHPSGDYLIFTSNKLGYQNFELFIVDSEGQREPVQASFLPGFDGLPVFLPSGDGLSWTRKNEKGESQIYMAAWDDQMARQLLNLKPQSPVLTKLSPKIHIEDEKKWLAYLADPAQGGRATGSPQTLEIFTQIEKAFKSFGLKPIDGKNFLQKFTFTSGVSLGPDNRLQLKGSDSDPTLTVGIDYTPLSFSKSGTLEPAEIVFVGYGLQVPASETNQSFDSFQGLDVKDKYVLAFRDLPQSIDAKKRAYYSLFSKPQHKSFVAQRNGAKGLILINGPLSEFKKPLMKIQFEGAAVSDLFVVSATDQLAQKILKSKNLSDLQKKADLGEVVQEPVSGLLLSGQIDIKKVESTGINVIGFLPSSKGGKENLMLAAHGDHLGHGDQGSSMAKSDEAGQVHPGADDNASGMTGVLELAHYFSKKENRLRKNLYFAIWSGEELGNIGSTHFLESFKKPLQAYVNMDMIGRLRSELSIQGVGSAKQWRAWFEQIDFSPVKIGLVADPYLPTDAMAFYMKKIPSISFFTGSHSEYHSPRDQYSTIDFAGLDQTIHAVRKTLVKLDSEKAPTYQKVESSRSDMKNRSFRIYLGTIPDYTKEGISGVSLTGTTKNSPADRAGLKENDLIVEMAGNPIKNLQEYMFVLQSLKANQLTSLKFIRDGKKMDLEIKPELKE